MASPHDADQAAFQKHLRVEVNRSLASGGLYAAGLGYFAAVMLGVSIAVTGNRFFVAPCVFGFFGGVIGTAISVLARRGRIHGAARYVVAICFVSLPTSMFVTSHFFYPAGAATFITGPFSYLYGFIIVVVGFLFSMRLTLVTSAVAAVEYFLVFYFLARAQMLEYVVPDADSFRDLTDTFIWLNKGVMFMFIGVATGGIGRIGRRLVLRALAEQHQKDRISGLFGQYVSDEVVDKLVAATEGVVGERKEVVILFSDLRGFSSFSEGRSPEEIVERLNAYFERMVGAIRAEGGVIDKFIGDAIMAVFGGVLPLDDPGASAVRAAGRMRRELAALNDLWAVEGIAPFDNGIGIHVGPVVQGPIGSSARKEFTVIGDAVNTASRLEGITKEKGAKVVVSDTLYTSLPSALQAPFRSLGTTTVKGKAELLQIWGCDDPLATD